MPYLQNLSSNIIDNPESTQFTIERLHQIKEEHETEIRRTGQEETKKHEKLEQEKNEKLKLFRTLLSEIKANQNKLQPISDIVDELANDCKDSSEEVMLPSILHFNTNYFYSLSGKLELLDDDSRAKLFLYYSELEYVKEEYKELKLIHGGTCISLVIIQFKEASKTKIIKPGWNEIAIFLERTKKAYDLGDELITNLEEKTGIKPVYNHSSMVIKEPLPIEHSRTKAPDILKLWFECKELKTQISRDKKGVIGYIETEYGGLPLDFDCEPHPDEKKRPIYSMLEEFYQKGNISENSKIKDSKEFVEMLIKDKNFSEMFETLRKNEVDLYQKTNEIDRWLAKIEPDFEKRRKELKDWYDGF